MNVYVFGNKETSFDNAAFEVAKKLATEFPKITFVEVGLNQDIPIEKNLIILDTVEGIDEPTLIGTKDLDKLIINNSTSVHDFDLGFQLKYLQKLGKTESVTIVGLPMNKPIDYLRIQSIFKKLVAQDIQGS